MSDPSFRIKRAIEANPQAAAVIGHLQRAGVPAWLVGGAVRDAIAGRPLADIDVVVDGGPAPIANEAGEKLGMSVFPLDRERGFYRLTKKSSLPFSCDICRLRAPSIREDLLSRDFTINAMAIGLSGGMEMIDPCGGMADLGKRTLRPVSPSALLDDPLRILRAHRLLLDHGLSPTLDLPPMISQAAAGLATVAGERVLAEMARLLATSISHKAVAAMAADGILAAVFPEAGFESQERMAAVVEMFPRLDRALEQRELREYLDKPVGAGMTIKHVAKWAAVFSHGATDPERRKSMVIASARRLKAPQAASRGAALMAWGWDGYKQWLSEEEIFDWLFTMGDWDQAAMAMALAWAGEDGETEVEAFSHAAAAMRQRWRAAWPKAAPPITGRDVMEVTGISPGPQVSYLLLLTQREMALGRIFTRDGALEFLARMVPGGE